MKKVQAKVVSVRKINSQVFLLRLRSAYLARSSSPGQFIHIYIDSAGCFLRRPLSIHSVKKDTLLILFKVRGKGTVALSRVKVSDSLDIVGPLGRGFSLSKTKGLSNTIVIGGGVGVAPLLFLAERLKAGKKESSSLRKIALLGARNKQEILSVSEFRKLGYKVYISTEDGSKGTKAKVTDLLKQVLGKGKLSGKTSLYACGPQEMFSHIAKVIDNRPDIYAEVSFEQFMGCGIGVCCGCAIETKSGYKKACKDGPVFPIKEIY